VTRWEIPRRAKLLLEFVIDSGLDDVLIRCHALDRGFKVAAPNTGDKRGLVAKLNSSGEKFPQPRLEIDCFTRILDFRA